MSDLPAISDPAAAVDVIHTGRPLYKRDTKGKLRVWYMERLGAQFHTVAGLDGGALTTSAWTDAVGKQKRSDVEQAIFEINAAYAHGLKREYFETPAEADGPKRFFKPMRAEKYAEAGGKKLAAWEGVLQRLAKAGFTPAPDNPTGVWAQPKLDGFRSITQASGLTTREGQSIVAVPHIGEVLSGFFAVNPDAVLDGELYNHGLATDFESLVSILKKKVDIAPEQFAFARDWVQLHVYDYAAPHVAHLPFSQRFAALKAEVGPIADASDGIIQIVETLPVTCEADVERLRNHYIDEDYEGEIVRLDLGGYENGRSWQSLKNKVFDDDEFEVVSILEGKGNYKGYAKKVLCRMKDGRTFEASIKGERGPKLAALLTETHKEVTIRFFGYTRGGTGVPRMGTTQVWHGPEGRTL